MNHKYITCTGFGGTGSSVISDLMKEYVNVKSCGDFEFTMSFDIDGISDLQHYIVDDFERSKVVEGIYRFRRYVNAIGRSYKQKLDVDLDLIIDDYLNDIINLSWMGSNHLSVYRKSRLGRLWYYKYNHFKSRLMQLFINNDGYERGTIYPKVHMEMSCDAGSGVFFKATQKMYGKILDSFDKDNKYEYLHFDQLVPMYNFERYYRYFPNLKIVCVDRDPRDLYLLNKIYWHEGWIPSDDLEIFVKWFRLIRLNFNANSDNVLFVKFEDCIYKYEQTITKIENFVGLDKKDHKEAKKYFNPDYSIRNTRIWEKHPEYNADVAYIAKQLNEYCYYY